MTTGSKAFDLALSVTLEAESAGAIVDKSRVQRALTLIERGYVNMDYRGMEQLPVRARAGRDALGAAAWFAQNANAERVRSLEVVYPAGDSGVLFILSGSIYLYYGAIVGAKWVFYLVAVVN